MTMTTATFVLLVFLIVISPFTTIWAINVIFPTLAIPYTFQTWLAIVVLGMFLKARKL